LVLKNKSRLQKEFKENIGFFVDKPNPVFRYSNDEKTARRFFQNSEISAKITKLDVD